MKPQINNLVKKHMHKFVRASVEVDKKDREKDGYVKHKNQLLEDIHEFDEDENND